MCRVPRGQRCSLHNLCSNANILGIVRGILYVLYVILDEILPVVLLLKCFAAEK